MRAISSAQNTKPADVAFLTDGFLQRIINL